MRLRNVRAVLRSGAFGLKFVVGNLWGRQAVPLIRGLVLSNRCNLRCRHCRVDERGAQHLDFAEVVAAIDAFYCEGGRCLYLEGGEPFLWRDGAHGLDDVISWAHHRGFLTVVIYTNGTLPIRTSADTVFVSVDGLRETHDALRGESFERILENIRESDHSSLYVNFTINSCNQNQLREFCEYVHGVDRIRGIFFYFHTPYYGYDELYLAPADRQRVLQQLLELRKRYRILNSRAGLQSALRNDWQRPMRACSVYEKGAVWECCRFAHNPELCRNCGYLSYAEIDQALKLKPSALWNAWKYF